MPFTFAHPAAVLPLRKYCPNILNMPALVVGSLMPDLGYYMHNWIWSVSGHAFSGSLCFDIPLGLVLLSLFYLNVRPVARLLPYPHREACSAICPVLKLPGLRAMLIASFSLFLGALTHILWDGFTHANGWCVRQISSSIPNLFYIGTYPVTIWHLLQHASTFLGLAFLLRAYNQYARSKRFLKHQSLLGPKTRALIWPLLLTIPAWRAVFDNVLYLSRGLGLPGLDSFVFNATVTYICVFIPLLCATGVLVSIFEYLFVPRRELKPVPILRPESEPVLAVAAKPPRLSTLAPSPHESMPIPVEGLIKQASI